ncbi:transcriptional regulator [Bordetella ansorpii]|uniref:Transcriptional regulator n=1 Tax=Bordetella ansorpii TaxID=288768 RepID=A0A157Q8F1_9BORD|nr:IclR family transcriptional regulator [Bordetella ansorpii]SAI42142.1 transcriptional regulator [Bordetella ansorpii]
MPRYPVRPADAAFSAEGGVTAVDRALTVLTAFRDDDRTLSLAELSNRTQMVRSTTLRLLASLAHFGFVQKTVDGNYALGPSVARLHRVYSASFSLEALVPEALRQLVERTQESASFHVRQGDQRLVLYRVNSPQPLSDQSRVGDLFPLDRGTGGHVLLAFAGAVGDRYDRIRAEGISAMPVSDRTPDLAGISVPVFDARQEVVGAVTLTMPAQRYAVRHCETVRETARALTLKLGGAVD